MRVVLRLLSGVLGMLAGWFALGIIVINLNWAQRDIGTVFLAFVEIGPIGGVIGFVSGVLLFNRLGVARSGTHISRPFAIAILVLAAAMAGWGCYEFLRS